MKGRDAQGLGLEHVAAMRPTPTTGLPRLGEPRKVWPVDDQDGARIDSFEKEPNHVLVRTKMLAFEKRSNILNEG